MFYDKLHTMMDKCQSLWDRLILKWLVKNWVTCEKLHAVNRLSGTTHACFIAHFIQCSNLADLYSTLRGCGLNCICAHGSDRFIFTLSSSLTSKMLTRENPWGWRMEGNGKRRSFKIINPMFWVSKLTSRTQFNTVYYSQCSAFLFNKYFSISTWSGQGKFSLISSGIHFLPENAFS